MEENVRCRPFRLENDRDRFLLSEGSISVNNRRIESFRETSIVRGSFEVSRRGLRRNSSPQVSEFSSTLGFADLSSTRSFFESSYSNRASSFIQFVYNHGTSPRLPGTRLSSDITHKHVHTHLHVKRHTHL